MSLRHKANAAIPSVGDDHDVIDLADATIATGDTAATTALQVKTKYLDAVTGAAYHMEIDLEGTAIAALAAFAGGAGAPSAGELTAMYARVNLLQTAMLAHMAGVGTRLVDGEHKAAETTVATTLTAVAAASSVATACTLAIALGVAVIAHGDSSGKHFHDDTTSDSGSGYTATSDLAAGNATADKCRIELNALRLAMATHFSNGAA
jgi:hypothetical protein